jgi:hypothetical protein
MIHTELPPHATENGSHRLRSVLLLSIVPLTVILIGLLVKQSLGPFWIGPNYDPDCLYLFASLNIANLMGPGLVAHPGTPLEVIGALVLVVTHFVAGQGSLVADVLTRTQVFMNALSYSLMGQTALILVFAGAVVLRRTRSIAMALLVQLSPLLSVHCIARVPRVMAETFLLGVSILLGAVVLVYVYRTDLEDEGLFPEVFGLLVGIAIASKVNSLPLALLPLLVMRGRRIMLRYAVTAGVSFFVCILPVILGGHWREFGNWLGSIVFHTGLYGKGAQGFIDPSVYVESAEKLLLNGPTLIAVFLLSVGALFWSRKRERESNSPKRFVLLRRSLFAAICVQMLQVFLVAKHPASRYLVPALGLMGTNLALMVGMVRETKGRFAKSFSSLLALTVSASILSFQVPQLIWLTRAQNGHVASQMHTVQEVERRNNSVVVLSYGSSSVPLALFVGDGEAGSRHRSVIAKMYPNFKYYPCGEDVFESSGKEIPLKDLLALDDAVLFCGSNLKERGCAAARFLELVYEPPETKPSHNAAARLYRFKKESSKEPLQ